MEQGYGIFFKEWIFDKSIKNELNLLLLISNLCAEKGYCWATNSYFSNLFEIDEVSVSRKIKKLEEKKYIKIEYEKRGAEVTFRRITIVESTSSINKNVNRRLTKKSIDDKQKNQSTINKNVKYNNTSINNTNNNINDSIVASAPKQTSLINFNFKKELIDYGADEKLVTEWLRVRKDKKATNTETALKGFLREVEKSNQPIDLILQVCIENSWKGFSTKFNYIDKVNDILNRTETPQISHETKNMNIDIPNDILAKLNAIRKQNGK